MANLLTADVVGIFKNSQPRSNKFSLLYGCIICYDLVWIYNSFNPKVCSSNDLIEIVLNTLMKFFLIIF